MVLLLGQMALHLRVDVGTGPHTWLRLNLVHVLL